MTTIDAKVYVIYKLYFGYHFGPNQVHHHCAWWKFVGSEERSNRDSVVSVIQHILYEYYLNTPLALQNLDGIHIVKFVMRYQFDRVIDRIKNFFWGIGAVVLKIIGSVLGAY